MSATKAPERSLRLLLELGRGGMGVVYLALQQGPAGFAKLKVVKRLRPDLAHESRAVEMFLEEGRLSARLNHPNVVQTNEVGYDGKHYFLELEYLEGQTLEQVTARARAAASGGLPIPLAVYVLSQALAGLHYAHELEDHDGAALRLVHRDASPHNIFLTYEGEVKVLDFGIAKSANSAHETETGVVKGKVTYMAPEQVAFRPFDRRVDVFAVGVILWQILAGERLWKDAEGFEIFLKLRSEDIPSPRGVREVDPELEAICMRALAREPGDRFATASEMQRALEGWLEARPSRVGAREVAETMGALFAEDRAAAKRTIEESLRSPPGSEGTSDRPEARGMRGMRALAFAAVGVALAASALAFVAVRARHARANHPTPAAPPGCAKNADCVAGEICPRGAGRCVALATDRCAVLAEPGDARDDRTVWIGAMYPTTGPRADAVGLPNTRAIDLARRDFVATTRGIPVLTEGALPRPFGVIACDDAADEVASAKHLVVDVGVPAVIGFKSSTEAIDLSRDLFVPRGVLVMTTNPSAQATQVAQPREGPRLVWRTTAASTLIAAPAARVVSDLWEPLLRRRGVVGDGRPMRVAVVTPRTQYGLSMAEALAKNLSFNGRPAGANGASFAQLVYDDPAAPDAGADYPSLVRQILDLSPHVILYAGEASLVDAVFAPVERAWVGEARPLWVSLTNLEGKRFFAYLGKDAELRRRFLGVSSPESTPANAQLAMHYSREVSRVTVNDTPAAPYDAAYLVAYAAAVVGGEPVTGRSLAQAIARLVPPGAPIDVGPTHVFEVAEALRHGGNVDLGGTDTRLDFDLTTGESTADWVIQCVDADAHGSAVDAIESGVSFDAATGKLRGKLQCP